VKSQHRAPERKPGTRVRTGERSSAERVYGLAAVKAAFETRPEAVLSIAHTEALRHPLAELLRAAAKRHIAYREVEAEELARLAQSVHHEGVCMLVRPRELPSGSALLKAVGAHGLVLALDGVQNPHNIGAILRSAAYFGAAGLVYTAVADEAAGSSQPASLSAAARRIAEGGAEHVPVVRVPALRPWLQEAQQADFTVVGSDAHADATLTGFAWPKRTVLVLGHEQRGLTREGRDSCQQLLKIAGSERMDSLNVSVAAGIFLASYAATPAARSATRATPTGRGKRA
jgi:TrmH RNA methyltransferase